MLRIFMGHDFFGAGNFGDDLMLAGFLKRRAASEEVTVVGYTAHNRASQQSRFPQLRWLRAAEERERALKKSDVWLGLGDTPFQLSSGPWSLDHLDRERELCKKLRKPMLFLGVGCEGPDSVRDPRARRVIEAAEKIWTRDARSAEVISVVAASGVVEQGADLANIALAEAPKPAPEHGIVGLLLGFENPDTVDLQAVEQYISRSPGKVRWLIQEARSFPCTERWNYERLAQPVQGLAPPMQASYSRGTIEEFLRNFGAPETVVSSRYHGALIAAWHGSRVGVIARSEKLLGIAADLGLPSIERIASARDVELLDSSAVQVDATRLAAFYDRAVAMCDAFVAWLGASKVRSWFPFRKTVFSS
jgi:polysaccharide pyruvyl transferase WcaK-like protein